MIAPAPLPPPSSAAARSRPVRSMNAISAACRSSGFAARAVSPASAGIVRNSSPTASA
jgi:hypothetical protein